jgi:hypothetical protein
MTLGPGVVAAFLWTFLLDVFVQSPQNFAREFKIHRMSWWKKFLMYNDFNIKNFVKFYGRGSGRRSSRKIFIID